MERTATQTAQTTLTAAGYTQATVRSDFPETWERQVNGDADEIDTIELHSDHVRRFTVSFGYYDSAPKWTFPTLAIALVCPWAL